MKTAIKRLVPMIGLVVLVVLFAGCVQQDDMLLPVEETYEYTAKYKNYVRPAVVDGWAELTALKTTVENDTFFCFTEDPAQADDFINAQRTLLQFLRNHGVETGEMEFYGTDYGYCFSLSSDAAAYVDFGVVRSWQQVLVTLQAIWGDYTDYGYVYAMANAVAEELNWKTDPISSVEKAPMDAFFAENPDAIHLLYPTFTTDFASEKTVEYCKALSMQLFEQIDWQNAINQPVSKQLNSFYKLVRSYAKAISVSFTRQACGYASYGDDVLLRIMTTYAELIVDRNYRDIMENIYGDYLGNYSTIYGTANIIDEEITASVAFFDLEEDAGIATIKLMDSENSSSEKFTGVTGGQYFFSTKTAYITSLYPYLHEYHHHLEGLINPRNGQTWQSQAFCEIGTSRSVYALYRMDLIYGEGKAAELFHSCTGRTYQPGREDYFEVYDMLCFIENNYDLGYYSGNTINSISGYMIKECGEKTTCQVMLHPETVEEVTGKSWEEWQEQWKQHIQLKYAGVVLPDWAEEYLQ